MTEVARLERASRPPLRRLLILQRHAFAARSLSRYLARHFDEIYVAESPDDAEAILEARAPTHFVCGSDFGPNAPSGQEMIPRWRGTCDSLLRVVLATGALEVPRELPGVDAVFHKPSHPSELLTLLLSGARN